MPEPESNAYSYWVVRYTPNLVRDEWLNVGVLLLDPARPRFGARFIEESAEFGRVRRLHPNSDETILRALERHFEAVVEGAEDPRAYLTKLGETLSNVVQLSPERGLLAESFEEELDRLYQQHVAPPRRVGAAARWIAGTRAAILGRVNDVLRRAGLAGRVERRVRIDEFTYQGDPLRLDYAYRRNGTRGFVQALSLERDASQAKVLAYTAERIREHLTSTEFTVITETVPQEGNDRHQFFARLLGDQRISVVPLGQLEPWANELRAHLHQ
ncbi:MAG TPA: DUF3037 domain-containing protein [Patescibacteria group bacterium]|nr:DUF3037 domain-containing protein [Patescibacteria group bacterium]